MSSLDKAVQTQIDNIQKKTGKSLDELSAIVKKSGLTKHGEIREMLMDKLGLGYGDANALVHAIIESDGTRAADGKSEDAVLDEIYSGAKAGFRPIHEKLMKEINKFGEFEIAPKKGYVSLRRKKQFTMFGQVDAIGQVLGGPIVAVIAAVGSATASLVASGLLLTPALFFINRANSQSMDVDSGEIEPVPVD